MNQLSLAAVACMVMCMAQATIIDIFEQANGQEPRVAINCGKVPFYVDLKTGAWIADHEGKVLCDNTNKEVVKSYCQKTYPHLNVTNIVEANKPVVFNNWCEEGSTACNTIKQVVPYRCLVHEYEADALMVPHGCTFDHLHDEDQCMGHDDWKMRARGKCHMNDMRLKNFGILLSCGTDLFTGVEFVCCPPREEAKVIAKKVKKQKMLEKKLRKVIKMERKGKISQKKFQKKQQKIQKKIQKHEKKIQQKKQKKHLLGGEHERATERMEKKEEKMEVKLARAVSNFQQYMPVETLGCDRAQFIIKEQSMQERHRSRIAAVVEEWDEAEKRYNKLKSKDPVAAEEKMKRTLEVFRETLAALEEEAKEEKARLRVEHASCINIAISKQKHDAMIEYIASVEEEPADSDKILKAVRKFIQVCEHDRVHSLRHFEHVRNRDPEKAKQMRAELLTHLKELNTVVNASMGLLSYLPRIAEQWGLGDVGVMLKPRLAMPEVQPIEAHNHDEMLPVVLRPDAVADAELKSDGTRQPIDELPAFKISEAPATEEVQPTGPPAVATEILPSEEGEDEDEDEFDTDFESEEPMLGDKDEEPEEFLPQLPLPQLPLLGDKGEVPQEFLPVEADNVPEKEEFLPSMLGDEHEVPEEFLPKKTPQLPTEEQDEDKPKDKEVPLKKTKRSEGENRSAGFAAVIGLSCGAIVIMLGILIALIVRRKRSLAHAHVVIPTEENDDQEHLVQMQKKGFENPTYKFYYY